MAKTKSFNRAAEITNTSQPTVSRQVKRLQDVVGSQLFISTPRGVKLTEKGEALAKALSRLDHTLLFDHERFKGGKQRGRRYRARQHYGRAEAGRRLASSTIALNGGKLYGLLDAVTILFSKTLPVVVWEVGDGT